MASRLKRQEGETVNWSMWIRQGLRWISMIFTATVIANFVARIWGEPPMWLTLSPLAPLFLLLFSGLYLFVLPYAGRGRGARPIDA